MSDDFEVRRSRMIERLWPAIANREKCGLVVAKHMAEEELLQLEQFIRAVIRDEVATARRPYTRADYDAAPEDGSRYR